MNSFEIKYKDHFRTVAKHLESGQIINTDAPKDNEGKGEYFSPTDLVCVALASCMLTIIAISLKKYKIDIMGTSAIITKKMQVNPRMISEIDIVITFFKDYDKRSKKIIQRAALNCPVYRSLSSKIDKKVEFRYPK